MSHYHDWGAQDTGKNSFYNLHYDCKRCGMVRKMYKLQRRSAHSVGYTGESQLQFYTASGLLICEGVSDHNFGFADGSKPPRCEGGE